MSNRRTPLVFHILIGATLVIMLLWVLFPFYWALLNSIKHPSDTFRPGTWVPFLTFNPTLDTWISNLSQREIRRALLNSTLISTGAATL